MRYEYVKFLFQLIDEIRILAETSTEKLIYRNKLSEKTIRFVYGGVCSAILFQNKLPTYLTLVGCGSK
jgi:hypothetical protein